MRGRPIHLLLTEDEARASLAALVRGLDPTSDPYRCLDALAVACRLRADLAAKGPEPSSSQRPRTIGGRP